MGLGDVKNFVIGHYVVKARNALALAITAASDRTQGGYDILARQ